MGSYGYPIFNISSNYETVFNSERYHFIFSTGTVLEFQCLQILTKSLYFYLLILTILMSVKQHLTVF